MSDTIHGVEVDPKFFRDPQPKTHGKEREATAVVQADAITTHTGRKHTCGTATPGECAACEWLSARLLSGVTDDQRVTTDDVLAQSRRFLSLEAHGGATGGLLDTWQADRIADPSRRYDADADVLRGALRIAQADKHTRTLVRSVLSQVAGTRPDTYGMAPKDVRAAMRTWTVPSFVRRDAKAVRTAVECAVLTAREELAASVPLVLKGDGQRWAVRAAPDPLTYGGPIVHERNVCAAWVASAAGEISRGRTVDPSPEIYALQVRFRVDPETGEQVREETRTPMPYVTDAHDTRRAFATRPDGTVAPSKVNGWHGWRGDRGTVSADRWALARRPTPGETADPLPPIAKPSNRKRKRDGAVGGPMVITHR